MSSRDGGTCTDQDYLINQIRFCICQVSAPRWCAERVAEYGVMSRLRSGRSRRCGVMSLVRLFVTYIYVLEPCPGVSVASDYQFEWLKIVLALPSRLSSKVFFSVGPGQKLPRRYIRSPIVRTMTGSRTLEDHNSLLFSTFVRS